MSKIKRIGRALSSMWFALTLLIVLAAFCALASLIPQGEPYAWYTANYPERTAALILALHLDDAFHSLWFAAINIFLCVNLLFCNLLRFPALLKRTRRDHRTVLPNGAASGTVEGVRNPERVFAALNLPPPVQSRTEDGRELLYASKNRVGYWGAWVCHLGILLLIAGFSLGQATRQEYTVYGVPGQTRPIGDTGYSLTIDDFRIDMREDDSVEQYTSEITVSAPDTFGNLRQESAAVSVNNPADLFGLTFYQNSTGWAAQVSVTENGEPMQQEVLCVGEYLPIQDKPELVVYFNAFYPDYELIPGKGPSTRSNRPDHPGYLYSVYYRGEILGMNVLMQDEELTIDEYAVTFSHPQSYTLLQAKRDAFVWLVFLGGMIVLAGLVLAFYVQPVQVWAVREENGGWTMGSLCPKGGVLFRERFLHAAAKAGTVNAHSVNHTANGKTSGKTDSETSGETDGKTSNETNGAIDGETNDETGGAESAGESAGDITGKAAEQEEGEKSKEADADAEH